MRVFVYYNLHKKCWSVKSMDKQDYGRVIAHVAGIVLENVKFVVSEKGRQRVIKEKRKNVHAGVVGQWKRPHLKATEDLRVAVSYNPYLGPTFFEKGSKKPVYEAQRALLNSDKLVYIGG